MMWNWVCIHTNHWLVLVAEGYLGVGNFFNKIREELIINYEIENISNNISAELRKKRPKEEKKAGPTRIDHTFPCKDSTLGLFLMQLMVLHENRPHTSTIRGRSWGKNVTTHTPNAMSPVVKCKTDFFMERSNSTEYQQQFQKLNWSNFLNQSQVHKQWIQNR